MHLYLSYDALRALRRGRGDKHKIDSFMLVTTRPVAHSGRFVCMQVVLYVWESIGDKN